jgi:hypothetical protein
MKAKPITLKCFVATTLCMLLSFATQANALQGINYQAVVRSNTGAILPNQHVNLRFTLHKDSLTGPADFIETDSVISNQQGIFTVIIGGGNIVAGSFDSIRWGLCSFFLQVEMDVNGGINFMDMGTSQLVSVPYSLYAKTAGSIDFTPTTYPTITGADTITVGTSPYIIISSTVTPSAAPVTLTAGLHAGQILCIAGTGMGSNGVRFTSGGLLNIGTGGHNDIQPGSTMMLMWSGMQWLQLSYNANQ